MAFELMGPIYNAVDAITSNFVNHITAQAIASLTPVVTVGLTVAFIAYGLLIIRGAVDMPVMDFLGKSVRIGIIVSIALAGGLYQSQIASALVSLPDEVATALVASPELGTGAAALVDNSAGKGFDVAADAFAKAGLFEDNGITYFFFGLIVSIFTAIVVAIGGAFLLMAKLVVAILAGLGPLFILALLFQPTARFFDMWVAQVLNYVLLVVLFAAVFGLMMDMYGHYMGGIKFDGQQNVAYSIGGAMILSIAMVVILLQLPAIAGALAGGVGLSYMFELRAIRGMAGSAGGAGRAMYQRGRLQSDGSRGRATGAIPAIARGSSAMYSKAAGYFKGRNAA